MLSYCTHSTILCRETTILPLSPFSRKGIRLMELKRDPRSLMLSLGLSAFNSMLCPHSALLCSTGRPTPASCQIDWLPPDWPVGGSDRNQVGGRKGEARMVLPFYLPQAVSPAAATFPVSPPPTRQAFCGSSYYLMTPVPPASQKPQLLPQWLQPQR